MNKVERSKPKSNHCANQYDIAHKCKLDFEVTTPLSNWFAKISKQYIFALAKAYLYACQMILKHLNALRALESSIRLGSFRAAAEELNVTPAAVGQQVKKLEAFLGTKLLERSPSGFRPTAVAEQVAQQLNLGFGHITEAANLLARRPNAHQLAISVVPTIAENWLAPRLPRFWQEQSGIDLRIDSTSTILSPDESGFDFAIRYGPEAPEGAETIDLFSEYLLPVCTPELASRIDANNHDNPFGDVPLLHTAPSTSDLNWWLWQQWCDAMEYRCPDPASGLKYTFTTLAIRAMFASHGIHLAQLSLVLPALAAGRLSAPFGPEMSKRTGLPYRLVRFNAANTCQLHECFQEWIVSESVETEAEIRCFLATN